MVLEETWDLCPMRGRGTETDGPTAPMMMTAQMGENEFGWYV